MRPSSSRRWLSLPVLVLVGAGPLLGGCVEVCEVVACGDGSATGSDGTGGAGAGPTSGGGDLGGGGGAPPAPTCEPQDDGEVGDDCGIFVDGTAATGGDGSRASPFRTLAEAIEPARLGSKRIYVCENADLVESVEIPSGLRLYGGLLCAATIRWSATGRTAWTAAPGAIPARLVGSGGSVHLEGFAIVAADAEAASGESSIAVLASDLSLSLRRTSLRSGQGGLGMPGVGGTVGAAGADATGQPAGAGSCGNAGGAGGTCTSSPIGPACGGGASGSPMGTGGSSGPGGTTCVAGGPGSPATVAGMSGPAAGRGTFDASGYVPDSGGAGLEGQPGSGGGGGGARPVMSVGKSGGGGGGGGCGGTGGSGGRSGGASFALALVGAAVAFEEVELASGKGGDGGVGGPGGPGGEGGLGAPGESGCKGGDGSKGSTGGSGGGGRGGPSALVAYAGTSAPPLSGAVDIDANARQGGLGASGAPAGEAEIILSFEVSP